MKYILVWYLTVGAGHAGMGGQAEFNGIEECMFAKTQIIQQWGGTFRTVDALCFPKGEDHVVPDNRVRPQRPPGSSL